jgi:hypothetical protein
MIQRVMLTAVVLLTSFAVAQTRPSKSSEATWNKIKSSEGHTKSRPVTIKFQPGTRAFRVTIKTTADKDERDRPNPSSSIRLALMTETLRDVEDKPVNWRQVDDIYYGKPGETFTESYDFPLGKDSQGKWFQVVITGYLARYDVTIEDQSAGKSSKSKKKKSDDSGDDDNDKPDDKGK